MRILVTGASGFIGRALVAYLEDQHQVISLARSDWDKPLPPVDAVVHLAGENIASKRWSAKRKGELFRSRIDTTRELVKRLADYPPKVFLCASAVGYYGDRAEELLEEGSVKGSGFLSDLAAAWEEEASHLKKTRVISMRFGLVLDPSGGALKQMLLPYRCKIGAYVDGEQFYSWIMLDDLVRAIRFLIENERISGPVNCVAPHPMRAGDLGKLLCNLTRCWIRIPLRPWLTRLFFGQMGGETLLASQKALPKKLQEAGFPFIFKTAQQGLEAKLLAPLDHPKHGFKN